jgi:cell wall-associated NlpC family hydrolase
VPYRSGGTTPRGFDCSGFTRYVFAKLHKQLPHSSQAQFNRADRVRHPRVGDLIFYHSGSGGAVYHVAIYAGHGQVWHATRPGERVRKTKIYSRHWTAGRF